MGIYASFNTDSELEKRGVLLDFGDYRVRIARAGGANKRFITVFEALLKPYRRAVELGSLSDEKATEIAHEAFAIAVVLGWETPVKSELGATEYKPYLIGEDGEQIEFSKEACIRLFTDLPDFFLTIRQEAEKASNFRRAALKEEAKN